MPFAFDVSAAVQPGSANLIEIEVWKPGVRYPMRSVLAGFLPDVATTFGGLWQSAQLRRGTVGFTDLQFSAQGASGIVDVTCGVAGANQGDCVDVALWHGDELVDLTVVNEPPMNVRARLQVGRPHLWNPEQPTLYRVIVRLRRGATVVAQQSQRVGFRRLSTRGEQLLWALVAGW